MDERYYSFSRYCKDTFAKRLYRVALDAHMNCPTRDGTLGYDGCVFCAGGSGDFAIDYDGQTLKREDFIFNHDDGEEGYYIAYFQAYTNTYAPIDKLRKLYESALKNPLFKGISIASRADCFEEDTYALLEDLKKHYPNKFIWVELGFQTSNEDVAKWINRGYKNSIFDECVLRLNAIGVDVIAHVIIGLKGDNVLDTIHYLNKLPIKGIKLQLLHYLKGSLLGKMYEENPNSFKVLSFEEYVDIVTKVITILRKDIVIHRLTGDGNVKNLLAPLWSLDKKKVLNEIRHILAINDWYQGCFDE